MGVTCPIPIYIDDEGIEAKDSVIIKDGILKGYMHNRSSAAYFNAEPMGNARAFAYYDEPLIRMRNTAILPGKSKLSGYDFINRGWILSNEVQQRTSRYHK